MQTVGKGLPDVCMDLNHFKDAFDWVEANNSGRIIPHEGVDTEYDSACKAIEEVESSLLKHLKEQRKLLGSTSVRLRPKMETVDGWSYHIAHTTNFEFSHLYITDILCQYWKRYIPIGSARKFVSEYSSGL